MLIYRPPSGPFVHTDVIYCALHSRDLIISLYSFYDHSNQAKEMKLFQRWKLDEKDAPQLQRTAGHRN